MVDIHSYLPSLMEKLQTMPIHEVMRSEERGRGHRVVVPGEVAWLSAADWRSTVVVSLDRNEVRLIAIDAIRPHTGALKRLLSAIEAEGLRPVIIEPFAEMTAIMKKWGWSCKRAGVGFYSEEQWRPRKALEVV